MGFGQGFAQGKAKPCALNLPREIALNLPERFHHPVQIGPGNPDTEIFHRKEEAAILLTPRRT